MHAIITFLRSFFLVVYTASLFAAAASTPQDRPVLPYKLRRAIALQHALSNITVVGRNGDKVLMALAEPLGFTPTMLRSRKRMQIKSPVRPYADLRMHDYVAGLADRRVAGTFVPVQNQYTLYIQPLLYTHELIYDILSMLKNNTTLANTVASCKMRILEDRFHTFGYIAPIVLQTESKQRAQRALNALYALTQHISGNGTPIPYAARVNNLLAISQGTKKDRRIYGPAMQRAYWQAPELIYFSPTFRSDVRVDHYLYHPETGKPLTSGR
jgi:hypothetical protein